MLITIIALLLGFIAIMLVMLVLVQARALRLSRRNRSIASIVHLDVNVERILSDVMAGVEHAADVSATLKLMQGLQDNPDALELIKSYPSTVQAAALLHYSNTLGEASRQADSSLEAALARYAHNSTTVREAENKVKKIQDMMDAATAASRRLNIKAVS